MRLLNSSSFQLEDFDPDKIPDYAILSHTWRKHEVSFADMKKGGAEGKVEYDKIQQSCQQPVAQECGYIWIDTCCIDKSSSAELSEAINSMYSWYEKAKTCYAYLADVPATSGTEIQRAAFANSRWFKRGWTLQELVAPSKEMVFLSSEWIEIGTKETLCEEIAAKTGISVSILTGTSFRTASIAKRMSWASGRETTRPEDIAYCLMGLFDINMPMLYGEGKKAFTRLQEEIIRNSDDQSLFAWTNSTEDAKRPCGLLASSPSRFANSGDIMPYNEWGSSAPFSTSNKGLRIELHLSPHEHEGFYVAALNCPVPPKYDNFLGIFLKRVFTGSDQYVRVKSDVLGDIKLRGNIQTIYVRNHPSNLEARGIYPTHAFQLRKGPTKDDGYKFVAAHPPSHNSAPKPVLISQRWPPARDQRPFETPVTKPRTFEISKGGSNLAGALLLERHDGERLVILLGSTTDFGVGFQVPSISDITDYEELKRSFRPQKAGRPVVTKYHEVRVSFDPQIHHGVKYYMVDIFVEAIYPRANPIDVISDTIMELPNHERPPNAMTTPSRGFGKLRFPFRSLRNQEPPELSKD